MRPVSGGVAARMDAGSVYGGRRGDPFGAPPHTDHEPKKSACMGRAPPPGDLIPRGPGPKMARVAAWALSAGWPPISNGSPMSRSPRPSRATALCFASGRVLRRAGQSGRAWAHPGGSKGGKTRSDRHPVADARGRPREIVGDLGHGHEARVAPAVNGEVRADEGLLQLRLGLGRRRHRVAPGGRHCGECGTACRSGGQEQTGVRSGGDGEREHRAPDLHRERPANLEQTGPPHRDQGPELRAVVLEEALAGQERDARVASGDGDVGDTQRALVAPPDDQRLLRQGHHVHRPPALAPVADDGLQHDVRRPRLRELHELCPLPLGRRDMGGEGGLAQLAWQGLEAEGAERALIEVQPALRPLAQASQVDALDGPAALARPEEGVVLAGALHQADAARLPLGAVLGASHARVLETEVGLLRAAVVARHDLPNAESEAAQAEDIILREAVARTGLITHDGPQPLRARHGGPVDPIAAAALRDAQKGFCAGRCCGALLLRGDGDRAADDGRRALHAEGVGVDVVGLEVEEVVGLAGKGARDHVHGMAGRRCAALRCQAGHVDR
mmetsp:Transcript_90046/g.251762  ORF Transcript_90046/g.251762 Transcript_90046/m.251762 type:complete len:559 (+) Transcript_90046:28-1704(+)